DRRGGGPPRDEPDRRHPPARAPLRARAGRRGVRSPPPLAEAGVRRRPARRPPLRLPARARRRARPPRAGRRARPVRSQSGDGAALHDQPVRRARARRALRHASAGGRARPPAARARLLVTGPLKRAARAALILKINRRRPTLPGGCPPSTIGPGRLNFSVRNGKRCLPAGMTAELSKASREIAGAWAFKTP